MSRFDRSRVFGLGSPGARRPTPPTAPTGAGGDPRPLPRTTRLRLDPEVEAASAARRGEIARLYALPDRALGEALLSMARAARAEHAEVLGRHGGPDSVVYDNNLLWHVVPEVARRLGAAVEPPEASKAEIRGLSDAGLRRAAHAYWANTSRPFGRSGGDPLDLLLAEPANGNPIAFALDRIAPPSADRGDGFGRRLAEINGHRGLGPVPRWTPELDAAYYVYAPDCRVVDLTTPEPPDLDPALLAAALTGQPEDGWDVPRRRRPHGVVPLWTREHSGGVAVGLAIEAHRRDTGATVRIHERDGCFSARWCRGRGALWSDRDLGTLDDIAADPDLARCVDRPAGPAPGR